MHKCKRSITKQKCSLFIIKDSLISLLTPTALYSDSLFSCRAMSESFRPPETWSVRRPLCWNSEEIHLLFLFYFYFTHIFFYLMWLCQSVQLRRTQVIYSEVYRNIFLFFSQWLLFDMLIFGAVGDFFVFWTKTSAFVSKRPSSVCQDWW